MAQDIFKRIEVKYVLTQEQYLSMRERLLPYMCEDEYGLSKIQSIYYDTDNYELIRNSLEKPVYKEKLRLRLYGNAADDNDTVFLELKKKYDGVVYKRRIALSYKEAMDYLEKGIYPKKDSQILREIDYFIKLYNPTKRTYISYDRVALYGKENPDLRITFDKNLGTVFEKKNFDSIKELNMLLNTGEYLMEIKVPGAMPVWMSEILSELKIYPSSFSKYGMASKKFLSFTTNENKENVKEGDRNVREYFIGNRITGNYA